MLQYIHTWLDILDHAHCICVNCSWIIKCLKYWPQWPVYILVKCLKYWPQWPVQTLVFALHSRLADIYKESGERYDFHTRAKKKKNRMMILVTDHANDGIVACVYEN